MPDTSYVTSYVEPAMMSNIIAHHSFIAQNNQFESQQQHHLQQIPRQTQYREQQEEEQKQLQGQRLMDNNNNFNNNMVNSGSMSSSNEQRYVRSEKIGEGSYGKVYKCLDKLTNTYVAIKVISWNSKDEGVPASAIREVSLLKELRHPNVIQLLDIICTDSKLQLVFEHLDKDLKRMLDQRLTPILGIKLKSIMYQLLCSLHACHRRRIVHRDIKPNNILVSRDEKVVKLADFGLGRAFCLPLQTYTTEVMTLYYRAPEILLGETHYLPAVDIWSMGCVFAELATGKPLFTGEGEFAQLIAIFQLLGTPNEQSWPGVTRLPHFNSQFPRWNASSLMTRVPTLDQDGIDLLQQMLLYCPEQRITAFDAMQHVFFDDVRHSNEIPHADYIYEGGSDGKEPYSVTLCEQH